jgi:hypothetical protein
LIMQEITRSATFSGGSDPLALALPSPLWS